MGDLFSFVSACGANDFSLRPLCDVDRLIFAQLSYCDFLPAMPFAPCPLPQAIRAMLAAAPSPDASEERFAFQRSDDQRLLSLLLHAPRYARIMFIDFTRLLCPDWQQFAALTLAIDDARLLAYRGTDNTLAGWKEDLALSCQPCIASQQEALRYLLRQAQARPGALSVCGHSKGGNLALYAALHAPADVQDRLACAVSFDGPGLPSETLERLLTPVLAARTRVLLPEGSLIGILFSQPPQVRTIACKWMGPLQHYPYFWQVEDGGFVDSPQTLFSRAAALTMEKWLLRLTLAQREQFTELLFDILQSTQAQTLNDLVRGWFSNTLPIARAILSHVDMPNIRLCAHMLFSFWRALAESAGILLSGSEKP